MFRSNQHIYAQVIDDTKGVTLVGLGSVSGVVQAALENDKRSATKTKDAATVVGRMLAEKCKEKGILTVVFDRGGCAAAQNACTRRAWRQRVCRRVYMLCSCLTRRVQVQVPRTHRCAGRWRKRGGLGVLVAARHAACGGSELDR